ncbi:MAG: hypothetical protein BWY71_01760 [Planctomycetes bacterium ADurb.Bin412]|nr:MAG: hypothetical protein BWY71_01760 [Planctomycetes bacterium ADurb.Bin412]
MADQFGKVGTQGELVLDVFELPAGADRQAPDLHFRAVQAVEFGQQQVFRDGRVRIDQAAEQGLAFDDEIEFRAGQAPALQHVLE